MSLRHKDRREPTPAQCGVHRPLPPSAHGRHVFVHGLQWLCRKANDAYRRGRADPQSCPRRHHRWMAHHAHAGYPLENRRDRRPDQLLTPASSSSLKTSAAADAQQRKAELSRRCGGACTNWGQSHSSLTDAANAPCPLVCGSRRVLDCRAAPCFDGRGCCLILCFERSRDGSSVAPSPSVVTFIFTFQVSDVRSSFAPGRNATTFRSYINRFSLALDPIVQDRLPIPCGPGRFRRGSLRIFIVACPARATHKAGPGLCAQPPPWCQWRCRGLVVVILSSSAQ